MEEAINRKMSAKIQNKSFERIWVVFDKDDFLFWQFNRAFDFAKADREIVPCWLNECFEHWCLLHFCFRDTGIGRNEIWDAVSKHLGEKYKKYDDRIFDKLSYRIDTAIRNAGKLAFIISNENEKRNPSKRVHELVKMLRELDPSTQQ